MKQYLISLVALFIVNFQTYAQIVTTDFTFENALSGMKNPEKVFRTDGSWFPYPAYEDRAAWGDITKEFKAQLVARGEDNLEHKWVSMTASEYLEYEKTGNRALYKNEDRNHTALRELVLAELAEGKGRFLEQIVDGLWFYSYKLTWSHPQHTRYQSSRRAIPVYDERPVTYHSSAVGATIALAWHFFKDSMDKMDPSISIAVKEAMNLNIFIPYMDDNQVGQSWQGFEKVRLLNNHTTNQNLNCTLCFMLMEEDSEKLMNALQRSVCIEDKFMSYIKHDGACEEGSSYWKASFGKVYEYCRLLYDFSDGKINLFNNELIRKMGEFKANAYLGEGYHMNYGDGAPRDYVSPALLYRFGKDTKSKLLKNFGLFLMVEEKDKFDNRNLPGKSGSLYLALETLRYGRTMSADQKVALQNAENNMDVLCRQLDIVESVYYPETEYAILRNDNDWVLTAKGAFNDESHNHNDVGSGMLYIESKPVIIDPGIGVYNKNTFGEKRYTEWCMRSDWHNLPVINGKIQEYGAEYKAANSTCDLRKKTFSTEIQGAYSPDADCSKWQRTYKITNKSAIITDVFELKSRKTSDVVNFIVNGDVRAETGHLVITAYNRTRDSSIEVILEYPQGMKVEFTYMDLSTDSKLKGNWKTNKLTRISLVSAEDAPLSGSYEFIFTKK